MNEKQLQSDQIKKDIASTDDAVSAMATRMGENPEEKDTPPVTEIKKVTNAPIAPRGSEEISKSPVVSTGKEVSEVAKLPPPTFGNLSKVFSMSASTLFGIGIRKLAQLMQSKDFEKHIRVTDKGDAVDKRFLNDDLGSKFGKKKKTPTLLGSEPLKD